MAVVSDLDPGRPHAVQLLGRRLVLWRDGGGAWRASEDRCPHRSAGAATLPTQSVINVFICPVVSLWSLPQELHYQRPKIIK